MTWDGSGFPDTTSGVFARVYDANGTALTGEINVNSTTANVQHQSSVATSADGSFVVSWNSMSQDGNQGGIYARKFDISGNALSTEVQVNETTSLSQDNPAIGMADGNVVIAWDGNGIGDDSGTFVRRLSSTGISFLVGDGVADSNVTFRGSIEDINVALDGLTYTPDSGFNGFDTLVFNITDPETFAEDSNFVSLTVEAPVSASPDIDLDADDSSGGAGSNFITSFTEGAGPILIADSDAALIDLDSPNLASLTVTLLNVLDGPAETLAANTIGTSISANYNSITGVLLLSGSDTVENYQSVLKTLTYDNLSESPNDSLRTVSFVANDGLNIGNTAVTAITINGVNDAPLLDTLGVMTLTTINEDDIANQGDLISDIIQSAGGDRITDFDTGAEEGFAIVGRNFGNGEWEYSTNGGTSWVTVSSVSETNALLLRDVDRLRFVPNQENASAPWLDIRAWDQTSGTAGGRVDVASNGGTTAFSSDIERVTLSVTGVNDAPTNLGSVPASILYVEDTSDTFDLSSIDLSDVDASPLDQLTLTITSANGSLRTSGWPGVIESGSQSQLVLTGILANLNDMLNDPSAFELDPPTDQAGVNVDQLTIHINDNGNNGTGGGANVLLGTIQVDVAAVNDAPVLSAGAVNDLNVNEDSGLSSLGLTGLNHTVGGGTDESSQLLSYNVISVPNPAVGNILLADGTTIVAPGTYTLAEIRGMQFAPVPDQSGTSTFEFEVVDDGGVSNGGADTLLHSIQITVDPCQRWSDYHESEWRCVKLWRWRFVHIGRYLERCIGE